ncbi:hypothetical protein GWI33_015994 [Rhynchophorus ferrugineus]|uniref:Uncharacterized protein n=1 Tax=Rhynchophorus ferrugineus TaxID=354439 RepID=A0A834I2V8_RHYFE|nr:hypothetical protein GWI33_015994 [Rhynchophorus ferrugineus]
MKFIPHKTFSFKSPPKTFKCHVSHKKHLIKYLGKFGASKLNAPHRTNSKVHLRKSARARRGKTQKTSQNAESNRRKVCEFLAASVNANRRIVFGSDRTLRDWRRRYGNKILNLPTEIFSLSEFVESSS